MISLKEFFSFKSNRFFWLNLIAMVAVVIASIFGVLEWLDSYTRHGESILVPASMFYPNCFRLVFAHNPKELPKVPIAKHWLG